MKVRVARLSEAWGLLLRRHKLKSLTRILGFNLSIVLSTSRQGSQHHVHTTRSLNVFWPARPYILWDWHSPAIVHVLRYVKHLT